MTSRLGNRQKLKEGLSLGKISIVAFHAAKVPTNVFSIYSTLIFHLTLDYNIYGLLLTIMLSGDVHPNPGPNSNVSYESYSSDDSQYYGNNLSIVHINVQSLLPKLEILEAEMQQYDKLVFTESWISPNISNEDIKITNFNAPYRNDRVERLAGGVAIYVKDGLQSQNRPDLISGNVEAVCIEVSFKNNKCLISGFYRPPNTGTNYWDLIEAMFDNTSNSPVKELIILGDFNCDMISSGTNKITYPASSYNLTQIIDEPTHYTEDSSSTIDLVLVNKLEDVLYSGVSSPFIPNLVVRYHCPTVFYLKHRKIVRKTFRRHIWLYDKGDYVTVRNKLNSIGWDGILATDDIIKCAEQFSDSIMLAARDSIPNKTVIFRPSEPSWINSNIKRNIRQRKRLYKKAKRIDTGEQFKRKRNDVNALIRTAKTKYKLANDL